jgi:aspartate-semialdehyde dehydrogenase
MDSDVPLVVPEVNRQAARLGAKEHGGRNIIANPNCSTIQMVVALAPLHREATLTRVIVSTYQSVSGAGMTGVRELLAGTRGLLAEDEPAPAKFPHPIAFNAIPHIDVFGDDGYTREERKMILETRKIMGLTGLSISATCVRIPVLKAHSEAVTVEFADPISADRARELLAAADGIEVIDDPAEALYPTPRKADGKDATFVGRIRQDLDLDGVLHFWVVSDNLLKGAALNAVQIAEILAEDDLLRSAP